MNGQIKGWNFRPQLNKVRYSAADGSTTLDSLRADKQRLEVRLAQIPGLISGLKHTIQVTENDITWLGSLNNRRKKNWEKENGKSVEQAMYDGTNNVVKWKGQVSALETEKSRIPEQIKAIDRQLESLVKGESSGLSKGLDAATAAKLGELEVIREKQKIQHETTLQQAEVEKAEAEKEQMKPWLKWTLIIGSVVLVAVTIILLVRRSKKKAAKVAADAAADAVAKASAAAAKGNPIKKIEV